MKMLWNSTTKTHPWLAREATGATVSPGLILTERKAQTIRGFGGCFNELGWHALSGLSPKSRESVLRDLFADEGCAFGFCRMPIGASDYGLEWYSLNDTPDDLAMENFSLVRDRQYLLPYIRAALAIRPEIEFFASPWSPPSWMKTHRVFNHGVLRDDPAVKESYALYFVKTVQEFAKEGVRIVQIHPQNEPVADQKFPSCVWTGAKMRDFIRDYLAPAFIKHGIDAEIWLGTLNTDRFDEWAFTVLTDPDCRKIIRGIGLQWAGKGMAQRIRQSFPDLPIMQTENECGEGKNSWEYAHYVFDLVWHYLQNGAESYVYWNMVLPAGGESTWGWNQNSLISVDMESGRAVYNPEYWVMKHLTHAVPPGSVRLEAGGEWSGKALAFQRPDGKRVVVIANPLPESRIVRVDAGAESFTLELDASSFHTIVLG